MIHHNTKELFFSLALQGLKIVPENFPERLNDEKEKAFIKQLELKLRQSYSKKKGFAMIDKHWSRNIGAEPPPADVICDIFLMCTSGMPIMITVTRECTEEVRKYNRNLAKKLKNTLVSKGGCLTHFGISFQIIQCDINKQVEFGRPANQALNYPKEYEMTASVFIKIREALVIVLAGFESSLFNPAVGVQFLYVLTPEQYKVCIKDDPYVIVGAPPGTGKTVVAIERIKLLARRAVPQNSILYLCENKALATCVRYV